MKNKLRQIFDVELHIEYNNIIDITKWFNRSIFFITAYRSPIRNHVRLFPVYPIPYNGSAY